MYVCVCVVALFCVSYVCALCEAKRREHRGHRLAPSVVWLGHSPTNTSLFTPPTSTTTKHKPRQSVPVGGIAYYISPPHSLAEIVADPFHALFYLVFILASCALFSKTWIEVSGAWLGMRGWGGDMGARR